ncbi:MAG TPA: hypothetical protein VNH45_05160 [Gaiellaceae bacterium]|nr:hypothetical protein [Gaiellaceae bacterium]
MRRSMVVLAVVALLTGCGGSSKPNFPTVGAARTYALVDFKPTAPAVAGKPTTVSFVIRQPNGKPLTSFRRGPGPHTGVHVIFVRRDLAAIVHVHPPVAADGTISEKITFTDPGPYQLVVDVYPNTTGPQRNFQLFGSLHVAGAYHPAPLPPFAPSVVTDGYRFTIAGRPSLHAIQAGFLTVHVTDPQGKPVRFTPWFGALAHAIFFRRGSLDYFHTHVCAPGAAGCTSTLGATKVTGSSSTPGKLDVGVLVPVPGEWRLFIQCRVAGHVLTAPFTLQVRP